MKYVIKFKDGYKQIYTYTHDDECEYIMYFDSEEKAEKFLETLDSREFDRWVEVEK